MSAILKTPMIQTMLAEMSTAQVSSMLAMMDTDQVPTDCTIGMASGGIPTTLATNPSFVTISMKQFYVMKTTADTPDTADLRKETKKVTGALYQPTAGTPNYSFIEFGQDICRFWAFINGQAMIVPETLSTVELRAEVLKRELEYFSTAISCDADGNVEVGKNLTVDGYMTQNSWKYDSDMPDVALPTAMTTAGFLIYYKHSRVSNGKLNIVICVKANNIASLSNQYFQLGTLTLPTDVMSKLYPDTIGSQNVIASQTLVSSKVSSDGTVAEAGIDSPMNLCVYKLTNSIQFSGNYTISASNVVAYWRFEFNFILS